jgi:hypothetical protein
MSTTTKSTPKTTRRPAAKAQAVTKGARKAAATMTPSAIKELWEPERATAIITIMRTDDISYERAVKRSLRRWHEARR